MKTKTKTECPNPHESYWPTFWKLEPSVRQEKLADVVDKILKGELPPPFPELQNSSVRASWREIYDHLGSTRKSVLGAVLWGRCKAWCGPDGMACSLAEWRKFLTPRFPSNADDSLWIPDLRLSREELKAEGIDVGLVRRLVDTKQINARFDGQTLLINKDDLQVVKLTGSQQLRRCDLGWRRKKEDPRDDPRFPGTYAGCYGAP